MHQFFKFILELKSTCFGQFPCPSSGVFHCIHSNGICYTGLLTACEQDQGGIVVPSWSCSQAVCKTVWHIPLLCVQWKTPDNGHLCPSSGVSHCTHSNGMCYTGLLTACEQEHMLLLASCLQNYTIAVCTVKDSWWWTEELSETCRNNNKGIM